jgi:hypothetical protein
MYILLFNYNILDNDDEYGPYCSQLNESEVVDDDDEEEDEDTDSIPEDRPYGSWKYVPISPKVVDVDDMIPSTKTGIFLII